MKLAICLSGQPRDIKNTLKNIKESWSTHQDIDFFFHGWKGENNVPFRQDAPSDVYTDDLFQYAIEILNPVNYQVEKQIIFEKQYQDSIHWGCYHPRFNTNPSQNIQSQFYSVNKSNQLKSSYEQSENFKYDAVLKCRFDYIFTKQYNLLDFNLNTLNIKNDCKHTSYAINDHIALSNTENIDVYSEIFYNLDKYYEMGIEFNPEVILGYHVHSNNIGVSKTLGDNNESYVSTTLERAIMYK